MSHYRYLACLDFEANCVEGGKLYPQEIIEVPIVIYDVKNQRIDPSKQFHAYCRPTIPLTPFCTQLTGITQDQVDAAEPFPVVLKRLDEWIQRHRFNTSNLLLVTHGSWDLQMAFPAQCAHTTSPIRPLFRTWCNIKKLVGCKIHGLDNMLRSYNLTFDGRAHSGIVDATNLARLVDVMVRQGIAFHPTNRFK